MPQTRAEATCMADIRVKDRRGDDARSSVAGRSPAGSVVFTGHRSSCFLSLSPRGRRSLCAAAGSSEQRGRAAEATGGHEAGLKPWFFFLSTRFGVKYLPVFAGQQTHGAG